MGNPATQPQKESTAANSSVGSEPASSSKLDEVQIDQPNEESKEVGEKPYQNPVHEKEFPNFSGPFETNRYGRPGLL